MPRRRVFYDDRFLVSASPHGGGELERKGEEGEKEDERKKQGQLLYTNPTMSERAGKKMKHD